MSKDIRNGLQRWVCNNGPSWTAKSATGQGYSFANWLTAAKTLRRR